MDALSIPYKPLALLLGLTLSTAIAPPESCLAADSTCCRHRHRPVFDGSTLCAWHRTWHSPDALATPLSPYYIPRLPSTCEFANCADGCGAAVADCYSTHGEIIWESGSALGCGCAAAGLEPAGMERLGLIPNSVELAGELPPAAVPRRGR